MKNYNYGSKKTVLDPPEPLHISSSPALSPSLLRPKASSFGSLNMHPGCSHELSPRPLKAGPPTILTTLCWFMCNVPLEQWRLLPGDKNVEDGPLPLSKNSEISVGSFTSSHSLASPWWPLPSLASYSHSTRQLDGHQSLHPGISLLSAHPPPLCSCWYWKVVIISGQLDSEHGWLSVFGFGIHSVCCC